MNAQNSIKEKFLTCNVLENLKSMFYNKKYNDEFTNFIDLLINELEGKERFSDQDEDSEMNEDEDSYITD